MECILHISYNLSFKKWSARTADMKQKRDEKKAYVQNQFKERMGLYVDYVKQGGGSSNDGNTQPVDFFPMHKFQLKSLELM